MIHSRTIRDIKEVLYTYSIFLYCIRYHDNATEWMTTDRVADCYGEEGFEAIREAAFRRGLAGCWHSFSVE